MIMLHQLTQVNLFRAWGNRPFALLWSGQALSRIGDFLYEVALAWWVLQESGSAGTMAAVLIFTLLFCLGSIFAAAAARGDTAVTC